jgi:hypothetical protein
MNWNLPDGKPLPSGVTEHCWESIHTALLMDLRDELKSLNRVLHCENFLRIPQKLDGIRRNTANKRRKV